MITENNNEAFDWGILGDIEEGRRTLGPDVPVIIYRLFEYTLKDVLVKKYGEEEAVELYRVAGLQAGKAFANEMLDLSADFDFFVSDLSRKLKDLKIGIMNIEQANLDDMTFTLTVSEDLECSGLPVLGESVCEYDEGFIAGILEVYTGKKFNVKEVDCWATGDRTCRFDIKAK